jgi:ubiquinone/menaquinone biosynthesis C-methylase UbiE
MMTRMRIWRNVSSIAAVMVFGGAALTAGQLASRPAEEWTKTLEGPARVAALKIDEVVASLRLRPGQTVADIGAGSGLLEVPLARAVGPKGRVYAVEIDAEFFPEIMKRAGDAKLTNVQTVLGKFTDPSLPVTTVDLALFHDVLHHVEDRAGYLKTLTRYLAPGGRITVVDYEGGQGPHKDQPELQVTRQQIATWMAAAGMTLVDDVKLFPDKYVLAYAKR